MDHQDHVRLLEKGIPKAGGVWADFGSGQGAFTLALAEVLGPAGQIISIDKDRGALRQQGRSMATHFPDVSVRYMEADFKKPIELPPLDGLVVANALHYLREKNKTIQLLMSYLRPSGRFLVVEYNTDRGNVWVPHPFSYPTWLELARRYGLTDTAILATVPSSFLGEIYSAVSRAPAARP
jgi:ubiquinone/menaquinone biosynthesis C-methylase UbiE